MTKPQKLEAAASGCVYAMIAAALILFLLSACTTTHEWQAATAERAQAPGFMQDGQCAPFARYMAARIPGAETVQWQVNLRDGRGVLMYAQHVAVAWTNAKGERWMMDNMSAPVWVGTAATPLDEQVRQFYATRYGIITAYMVVILAAK